MSPKLLIAGVGNIFFGDDAFGVELARQLRNRDFGPDVRVVEYGIRPYDLAFTLCEGYDGLILLDALQRGGTPGQIHVLAVDPSLPIEGSAPTGHTLNASQALGLANTLGARLQFLRVVGCEPEKWDYDQSGEFGLSEVVKRSLREAEDAVEHLVMEFQAQTYA